MVVSSRHVVKHLRQIETLHSSPKALRTRNNNKQKAHKKLLYTPPSKLQRKKNIKKKHPFSVGSCHQKKGLLKDLSFPHQTELFFKQRAHGMLVYKAGKEKG